MVFKRLSVSINLLLKAREIIHKINDQYTTYINNINLKSIYSLNNNYFFGCATITFWWRLDKYGEYYVPFLKLLICFLFITVFGSHAVASNAEPAPSSEVQLKQSNTAASLGISVDFLPKWLVAQLPEDVLVEQGVMVTGFTENSSAVKQGIKLFDILLAYDQQALMHPKNLIDRVRRDRIGREVKLQIVRKGKIIMVPVILGTQFYPLDEDQLDYQYNLQVLGYDGVNIKLHNNDYFTAAIRYLAPDGVVRRRNYAAYYPVIIRQIQQTPDLSNNAKSDLLRAIKKRKDDEDGWFDGMMPFSDGVF